jgi:bacterioferritin
MRGDPRIIDVLNEVLTAELTAVNQYFLHGKMAANWGYHRIAEYDKHESIDEMRHAEQVTDRILFLEGIPNYQRYFPLRIGETIPEQFECDLQLEYDAIARLNAGIATAVELGDNGTRELLAGILVAEEEHADWLETQLETIKQIGVEHYLAQQLHG